MTEHIQWNDKGQPVSTVFDDVYFSTDDGLAESRYVFLQQNQLQQRFCALEKNGTFTIAETGFGTGLNFLATCELWSQCHDQQATNHYINDQHLHFISVEKFPLAYNDIVRALNLWPSLQCYSDALLAVYPHTLSGIHRINISPSITLTLIIDEAATGLNDLLANTHTCLSPDESRQWRGVDAWFLDGFAPSKNPDMWSDSLFNTMARLSHKEATLATFTAAGDVRRGLNAHNFTLHKVKGYGRKREMLAGSYTPKDTRPPNNKHTTPWAAIANYSTTPTNQSIAVIGGGIAGCHTAYALAQKGYNVTLIEREGQLAAGASGNQQGIVYAKLSASREPAGEFNLFSLLYAQRLYSQYWQDMEEADNAGSACGVLQLSMDEKTQNAHQKIAQRFSAKTVRYSLEHDFKHEGKGQKHASSIRYVSAEEASDIANTAIPYPALYLPDSGWIHPHQLCHWLIQHPNIKVIHHTHIESLNREDEQWHLTGHSNEASLSTPTKETAVIDKELENGTFNNVFDCVIVANAYDALRFEQTAHLPIKRIRGQVTHYPSNAKSQALSTVVCGKGYIAPATTAINHDDTFHCLGASFNLGVTDTQLNPNDHIHNLETIAKQAPDLVTKEVLQEANNSSHTLAGRVGFRCTTPDYLPITGAAPQAENFITEYQSLSHDAKKAVPCAGTYHPHLYVNLGYGSRGLAYTPLCSEILASLIHGDPPPIAQSLVEKLNPARFLIRQLIRS